jgi:hypothetical protein
MIWDMTDAQYTDAFNFIRKVKDLLRELFDPRGSTEAWIVERRLVVYWVRGGGTSDGDWKLALLQCRFSEDDSTDRCM